MDDKEFDRRLVEEFVRLAEADLKSAEVELENGLFHNSVYHSQQAAEKIVKALLITHNKFVDTHILTPILKEIEEIERIEEKVINFLNELEKHWVKTRYPFKMNRFVWTP